MEERVKNKLWTFEIERYKTMTLDIDTKGLNFSDCIENVMGKGENA